MSGGEWAAHPLALVAGAAEDLDGLDDDEPVSGGTRRASSADASQSVCAHPSLPENKPLDSGNLKSLRELSTPRPLMMALVVAMAWMMLPAIPLAAKRLCWGMP